MKCQNLFSGKNKKNISKCHLLNFLPRVLSINILSPSVNNLIIIAIFITLLFFVLFFSFLIVS